MTTRVLLRRLISKTLNKTLTPRSFSTTSTTTTILRIRPLISVVASTLRHTTTTHAFCTSSDDDQYSNWTTCPSEDEILVDEKPEGEPMHGCDFEHWFVEVEKPEGEPTRDEIIESYINTLAKAVGIRCIYGPDKISFRIETSFDKYDNPLLSSSDDDNPFEGAFMDPLISKTLTPRSLPTTSTTTTILRIRPLISVVASTLRHTTTTNAFCTSSDDDQYSNWTTCPSEDEILVDEKPEREPMHGCDFEHCYDDARMKIYSVSTRCYYAFGALLSEEDSDKLIELPGVIWVLPDSYEDVENKRYRGEPFIDGKAVPYDPKYHEKWIRDNARINKRQEEQEETTRNG
ncbi:cobalt ion binding protein [Artemisia annua]|uniref:Cobalt ion binding protein n=1 Tax=Artemisia annua TaxID=35608 RepID=A0A2U1NYA6_ARTAN|nr:cobalt ion binding protein [Artemisia annua]